MEGEGKVEVVFLTRVSKRRLADGSIQFTLWSDDNRIFKTTAHGASQYPGWHRLVFHDGRVVSVQALRK